MHYGLSGYLPSRNSMTSKDTDEFEHIKCMRSNPSWSVVCRATRFSSSKSRIMSSGQSIPIAAQVEEKRTTFIQDFCAFRIMLNEQSYC